MQPEPPARQRPKRGKYDRRPEVVQFDVLEGRFTRAFHMVFRRREVSARKARPYPWFIGGVHRFARQLDVAVTWELMYIFATPFIVAFFVFSHRLGLPQMLGGYAVLLTCCYFGLLFVFLVVLDRRLDTDDYQRVKGWREIKRTERDTRFTERRDAKLKREEMTEAAREAEARGQTKAGQPHGTVGGAPAPARESKIALDELLDPH